MKVAAMWSGGKDSSLATYESILQGHEVISLINYSYEVTPEDNISLSNRIFDLFFNSAMETTPIFTNLTSIIYKKDLSCMIPHIVTLETVSKQAEAMELPLLHGRVRWDTTEKFLRTTIRDLKKEGVEGIVFGVTPPHFPLDSSEKLREHHTLRAHREWMNQICQDLGVKLITPLWERSPEQILGRLVSSGFESVIIVVDTRYFSKRWLGRSINNDFMDVTFRLKNEKDLHVGGSAYHTLVVDGPMFKRRLEILKGQKIFNKLYGVYTIDELGLQRK